MKNNNALKDTIIAIVVIAVIAFFVFGFLRRIPGKRPPEENPEINQYADQ